MIVELKMECMMKKRLFTPWIGLLSLLLGYASCATTEGAMSELDGEWELVSVVMDTTVLDLNGLSADIDPYFGFDFSEARFYGNSAYNALSGNLSADSLENGQLSIHHLGTTMMASPTMSLEQSIVDNLERVQRFETYGAGADTLEFFDEKGQILFKLTRRAPYSRLMGKWQFVEIKGEDIEPQTDETLPYVVFDINHAAKMIFGFTGCNAFNGSVRLEVGNSKIHFGDIAVAGAHCEDIEWEADLLNSFQTADTYEVSHDEIRIFDAKGDEIVRLKKMH